MLDIWLPPDITSSTKYNYGVPCSKSIHTCTPHAACVCFFAWKRERFLLPDETRDSGLLKRAHLGRRLTAWALGHTRVSTSH